MSIRILCFLAGLCVTGTLMAQPKLSNNMDDNTVVPIIDREIFFGNPEIAGGQLSPDGKMISFMKAYNGTLNIWVKKMEEPFDKAKPLTNNERPVGGYFWSNDGKYILFVKDKGGNENYNIYAIDPLAPAGDGGVPEARNLTNNEKVRALIYQVSKKNPNLMMVGLNERDAAWHDLYQLDIATGKLTLLRENKDRISGWGFDWEENLRLALRSAEDGSTEVLRVDKDKLEKIYEVGALESAGPINWTKDNKKVYMSTNKGAETDLAKLVLMDPMTGKVTDVESDPLKRVDLEGASFSDVTHELVVTAYVDDKERMYWKDKTWEADYAFLEGRFPGREVSMGSSTRDESKMLVTVSGDKYATEVYFFDRKKKELVFQYTPRPKLKEIEQYLAEMKPIRYKSSDGLEIPAYLTLPVGQEAKNLPLLVFPHGGPWARDNWGFDPYAQFFANRGFAVLQINFRGSTGFGKKFLDAGNLQWGKLMQDDITWGVKHLTGNGTADAKKVAIMGGSYGGYAVLAGLAFTPELYAAGVDIVGPSNLFTLLSTIPPYWEAGRKFFELRMGSENTPEGKALLTAASPLFSAEKIKSPLMIVQGANDPRVKKAESDQIVVALRQLGTDVVYIMADDEGHGFAKPVNNMGMIAASEKFLANYCGTRYQSDMPEEVASRLQEMTQDIAKVTLANKEDIAVLEKMPAPSMAVQPGSYTYEMVIEVQGQTIPMSMTREVVVDKEGWKVTDKSSTPMGDALDENHFASGSLNVTKRAVKQGPADITIDFGKDATTMTAMGTTMSADVEGVMVADGAGADMVIARMPLTEGFATSFYQFDAQSGKNKKMNLKVAGKEMINEQECWKVTLTNTENEAEMQTLWIDGKKGMALKSTSVIPAMGNAKVTMTLN